MFNDISFPKNVVPFYPFLGLQQNVLEIVFQVVFFFLVCIDGVFDNENENYPAGIEIVVKDKNLRYLTMMYKFLSR